jgi:hypothetical protein
MMNSFAIFAALAVAIVSADSFTLGGSNTAYPGYGCLSSANDVTLSDYTLAECEAACVARSTCKSFDFYVDRTGHTCSLSDSNFADVGSTTSTTDCRYYEKVAAAPLCSVSCAMNGRMVQVTHDITSSHTQHKCWLSDGNDLTSDCICSCCNGASNDCTQASNWEL